MKKWMVLLTVAFVAGLMATSAPAMADEPCENAVVKVKCKVKGMEKVDAKLKLKKGPRETEIAFVITNGEGPNVVLLATTNRGGKAKVRTDELVEGMHEFQVYIVEGRVPCIGGEFECE